MQIFTVVVLRLLRLERGALCKVKQSKGHRSVLNLFVISGRGKFV